MSDGDRGSSDDVGGDDDPPDPQTPSHRLVRGTVVIDDLDSFLFRLDEIAAETGAVVQAFDADLVVSDDHLRAATHLAARAIARGEAVARDPGVEILLYAAGRRQIDRALTLGVAEGEQRAVVLAADFGEVAGADRPAADLGATVAAIEELTAAADATAQFDAERVREFYGVSDAELAATAGGLEDVVRERVALLDVEK
ncbi:KEOPS complex subunit Cgi121 [Halorubrum sp. AD140]|uniref:KEOPS complex subunit Cgi121 n=1 Tax=Halorubrum sp. AD140 TaxID=3050073 RepID=UPI002ACCE60E|nr:KEOPS complex subunit Cgi121 [Halorubrum sp. AD140]MDZ5812799.1 KEOPS complex subunit Cgi121 [Halorubrum sp. AD140]